MIFKENFWIYSVKHMMDGSTGMLYTPEKSLKRMAVDHYQSYLQLNMDNQTLNETITSLKM